MARTPISPEDFVKEHRAPKGDVPKGKARVCTRKDCACGNVPLDMEAFYRDKSAKGGRSPWCKLAERTYNAAYYAALKDDEVKAPRKRDIANAKGTKRFEVRMASVRTPRTRKAATTTKDGTRTSTAKTAKARTTTRRAARARKVQDKVAA